MGFLRWIKRDSYCRRRESEPPMPMNGSSASPRDDSYVKALSKFNEWRNGQLNKNPSRVGRKQSRKAAQKTRKGQTNLINTDTNANDLSALSNDLYEEIQIPFENTIEYRDCTKILSIRHSFPVNEIQRNKRIDEIRTKQKDQTIYENEIFEFENVDLAANLSHLGSIQNENISSPPVKFYRENSNPFANVKSPNRITPQNTKSKFQKKFNLNTTQPSTLSNVENLSHIDKSYSLCPPYQIVLNKHGDEVEYALPMNEKFDDYSYENCIVSNENNFNDLEGTNKFEDYIEKNFNFLNENSNTGLNPSLSASRGFSKDDVIVTDLDKSDEDAKAADKVLSNNDIMTELYSLQVWSKNIGLDDDIQRNNLKSYKNDLRYSELLMCDINEIVLSQTPLQGLPKNFLSGSFHNIPVTLNMREDIINPLQERGLQINFEIIKKIRHSNVVLLMGICTDTNDRLNCLILEPLKCSLNYFIHKERQSLSSEDCVSYTLQIVKAAIYVHKHGMIHSNISSQSILLCEYQNCVKLSSFEVATQLPDIIKDEVKTACTKDVVNGDLKEVPTKFLPHIINYRKLYTQHYYQSPELLSTKSELVFPTPETDVYGITLTLWEMLNGSVPFDSFSYEDMEKLFYLKNAQLPIFNENKCKPFEHILKNGLQINPKERIKSLIELDSMLEGLRTKTGISEKNTVPNNSTLDEFSKLLNSKPCGSGAVVYERTSTIKRRKNQLANGNRITAKQLFNAEDSNNSDKGTTPNSTEEKANYQFKIDEIFLPDTPIARSNKLRKTAWLTNNTISPIYPSEDIKSSKNTTDIPSPQTPVTKHYNVNIRIVQSSGEKADISSQIKQWNTLSSPIVQNKDVTDLKQATNDELKRKISRIRKSESPSTDTNNYYPNMPELFSETFYKKHLSSKNDFENTLWRREKIRCEQNSFGSEKDGVFTPKRISVKDTVNKFESFSKDSDNTPQKVCHRKNIFTDVSENSPPPPATQVDESEIVAPQPQNMNVSKLNVTLRNNMEKKDKKTGSKLKSKTVEGTSQTSLTPVTAAENVLDTQTPKLLTLNFKKLERRASDVSNYFVQKNFRKDRRQRHSIYGTEIFKRLSKTTIFGSENFDFDPTKVSSPSRDSPRKNDFKIKLGKLTCLNCGHKLFVVDDIQKNGNNESKGACSELFLKPLKRTQTLSTFQNAKSIEDLYIDDDFRENIELGANMELGTKSDFFDIIDFDIIAAGIFSPDNSTNVFNLSSP